MENAHVILNAGRKQRAQAAFLARRNRAKGSFAVDVSPTSKSLGARSKERDRELLLLVLAAAVGKELKVLKKEGFNVVKGTGPHFLSLIDTVDRLSYCVSQSCLSSSQIDVNQRKNDGRTPENRSDTELEHLAYLFEFFAASVPGALRQGRSSISFSSAESQLSPTDLPLMLSRYLQDSLRSFAAGSYELKRVFVEDGAPEWYSERAARTVWLMQKPSETESSEALMNVDRSGQTSGFGASRGLPVEHLPRRTTSRDSQRNRFAIAQLNSSMTSPSTLMSVFGSFVRLLDPCFLARHSPLFSYAPVRCFSSAEKQMRLMKAVFSSLVPHKTYQHSSFVWAVDPTLHGIDVAEEEVLQLASLGPAFYNIMHKERFFPMTAVDPHHDTAKGVLKSSFELLRLIEGCRHSVVYRDQIGRAAGSALAVNNLPFLRALLKEWRQWAGHQTVLHPKKRTTQQLCYLLSDVRKVQRAIEVLSDAVLKTAAHSGNMTGSSITLSNIDFGVDQELFETRVLEGRLIDCLREDSLRLSKDLWSALPKQYFKSKDIGLGVETSVNEGSVATGFPVYGKGTISATMVDIHKNVLIPARDSLEFTEKDLQLHVLCLYATSIVHVLLARCKESPVRVTSYGGHKIAADVRFLMAWLRGVADDQQHSAAVNIDKLPHETDGVEAVTELGDYPHNNKETFLSSSFANGGGEGQGSVVVTNSQFRMSSAGEGKKDQSNVRAFELVTVTGKTVAHGKRVGVVRGLFERALTAAQVLTLPEVEAAYEAVKLSDGSEWISLRKGPLKKSKRKDERSKHKRICGAT